MCSRCLSLLSDRLGESSKHVMQLHILYPLQYGFASCMFPRWFPYTWHMSSTMIEGGIMATMPIPLQITDCGASVTTNGCSCAVDTAIPSPTIRGRTKCLQKSHDWQYQWSSVFMSLTWECRAGCAQIWNDYKLRWMPVEYDGIEFIRVPANKLWRPDIVLYNK